MRRSCGAVLAAMCALLAYSGAERGAAAQADTPVIAAAADLKFALPEVAAEFKKQTGHELKLVFGSSGQFATQIENGAPFQLFLSADESYVRRLAAKLVLGENAVQVMQFAASGSSQGGILPLSLVLAPDAVKLDRAE